MVLESMGRTHLIWHAAYIERESDRGREGGTERERGRENERESRGMVVVGGWV
jgi:hypothetical protein